MPVFSSSGFKGFDVSSNGQAVRFVFANAQDEDVELVLAAEALPLLLPYFVLADAEAQANRGENNSTVFPLEQFAAGIADDGSIVISLSVPGGAQFAFQLDSESAARTRDALNALLSKLGPSPTRPLAH